MTFKIGIISTCVGAEEVYRKHLSEIEQIIALLKAVRTEWQFNTYRAYLGEYPENIDDCDGYVFSGSPVSVNAPDVWIDETLDYIRRLHAVEKSMIGICFGHQAIAKALGGKVAESPEGWSLGSITVRFSGQASWMIPQKDALQLFAAHCEQVVIPPNRAKILGRTDACPIASFSIGNHIFTTQHHPEMTAKFVASAIDYLSLNLDPGIIHRARVSLKYDAENAHFAEWMAKFLERTAT